MDCRRGGVAHLRPATRDGADETYTDEMRKAPVSVRFTANAAGAKSKEKFRASKVGPTNPGILTQRKIDAIDLRCVHPGSGLPRTTDNTPDGL